MTDSINQTSLVPVREAETAVASVAAQVVANVQARYALAKKMPRDYDDVRVKLLKECKRPRFAEVAIYNKPIGKGVEGPSIRFAEAALRCMGNVMPEVMTVYDDDNKRIVRVSVTDLEANITYTKDVSITKTVERQNPKGYEVLGSRLNSKGMTVYIVRATDDDIMNKENALVSKALRTVGLRLVPGDILDEALEQVRATLHDSAAQDPDAALKRVADGFAAIGVSPSHLAGYLRHSLAQTTPAELAKLRGIYTTIRDGETTWSEVSGDGQEAPTLDVPETRPSKASRAADVLRGRRAADAPKPPPVVEPAHDPATGEVTPTEDWSHVGPPPMED